MKHLETITNVAILLVCATTLGVTVWRFVIPHKPPHPEMKQIIGRHLQLAGISWASTDKTVVLALSTHCRFCSEGAPSFRSLIAAAHRQNLRVIAVLPQSAEESANYLSGMHLEVDAIISASLDKIGVSATPTVLFINSSGAVVDGWIGNISPQEQQTFLKKL